MNDPWTFNINYRREMETLVRRRDVEEWMRHENLPENLRRYKSHASLFSSITVINH